MSPAYFDSIQEVKCIPSFLSVPMDEKQCVQDVAEIHDAAECHKSLNEYLPAKIEDQMHPEEMVKPTLNPSPVVSVSVNDKGDLCSGETAPNGDAPILLVSQHAFLSTVDMLLPANGPPEEVIDFDHHANVSTPSYLFYDAWHLSSTPQGYNLLPSNICKLLSLTQKTDSIVHAPLELVVKSNHHDLHLADPLSVDMTLKLTTKPIIESCQHSLDHGEGVPTLDHGEIQPMPFAIQPLLIVDSNDRAFLMSSQENGQPIHAHVIQAAKDHDKDLDNDGGITTKLLSTIASDDPITDVLINSVYYGVALLHGLYTSKLYYKTTS
jgi:hypothetical protein